LGSGLNEKRTGISGGGNATVTGMAGLDGERGNKDQSGLLFLLGGLRLRVATIIGG